MAIHQVKLWGRGYITRHYFVRWSVHKGGKQEHAKDTLDTNAGRTKTKPKRKKLTNVLIKRLTARVGVKLNRPYIPLNEPELLKLCVINDSPGPNFSVANNPNI